MTGSETAPNSTSGTLAMARSSPRVGSGRKSTATADQPSPHPTTPVAARRKCTTEIIRTSEKRESACENNENDHDVEPPARRRRIHTHDAPCCSCTRYSTCSRGPTAKMNGCSCVAAGRKCSNCACFRHCVNRDRETDDQDPPSQATQTSPRKTSKNPSNTIPAWWASACSTK